MLSNIEILPKGILFWRCFTHWLGGLGILFIAIALLPALGFDGQAVAAAELTGPTFSKIMPKITNTARAMYVIYITFTLTETVLLMFGGLAGLTRSLILFRLSPQADFLIITAAQLTLTVHMWTA